MRNPARLARVVLLARNPKLGRVVCTHAPIMQTCSRSCPLLDNGCYAQRGWGAVHMRRLERYAAGVGATALDVAKSEAVQIERLAKSRGVQGRPLRLHYSGDARTVAAARVLATACAKWPGPVWTYTHAHRDVPREAWGSVSVLASCESSSEGGGALARGYAPAVVLPELPKDGRAFERHGVRWVPCPATTKGTTCEKCKLCFDGDKLVERRTGIAFEAHGSGESKVRKVLHASAQKHRLPMLHGARLTFSDSMRA